MMNTETAQLTPMHLGPCTSFGELLSYPTDRLKMTAADCYDQLKQSAPDAAKVFEEFLQYLDQQSTRQIQESFTSAFDLQALCQPYVGYQLCGESQARTIFMMKLKELYESHNFSCGTELPDHLNVLLCYIGSINDPKGNAEIVVDALLPAVKKIVAEDEMQTHPYLPLVKSLELYLTHVVEAAMPDVCETETPVQKEMSHG